jgi:hypothetical protein
MVAVLDSGTEAAGRVSVPNLAALPQLRQRVKVYDVGVCLVPRLSAKTQCQDLVPRLSAKT